MIRSIQAALLATPLLAGLAGCGPSPATAAPLTPLPAPPSQWRMLTVEEGDDPTPLGYLEIQSVPGPEGLQGTVYLVHDREFRVLGHITRKGYALRYRDRQDDIGENLGVESLPNQLKRILKTERPLRSFDLRGQPKGLP